MKTEILPVNQENIERSALALIEGQLVAFPSETVYGLGADARSVRAIAAVFGAKERPEFDPLIVHIPAPVGDNDWKPAAYLESLDLVELSNFQPLALARLNLLARLFWPGPLTMVLPRAKSVLDLVTSGLETVAVRMPHHSVTQNLLQRLRALGHSGLIVGPSANRFGRISPTTANDVWSELNGRIPLILDGGRAQVGIESTVVMIEANGDVRLLRPGALGPEKIETVIGAKLGSSQGLSTRVAPGLMKSHYAPQKPLLLLPVSIEDLKEDQWQTLLTQLQILESRRGQSENIGLLAYSGDLKTKTQLLQKRLGPRPGLGITAKILTPDGDLEKAAHVLFGSMRVLDLSPADLILAEPCPHRHGLVWAIQDRLQKASTAFADGPSSPS